jgi:glycogen debranching enzyme
VPVEGVGPYRRRDTDHADAAHRPTKEQYDRYVALVQGFRALRWDNARLHDASPFRVVDPGFNAILIRSAADLADLAGALGEREVAAENRRFAVTGLAALERLWSPDHGQYLCRDRVTGRLVDSASVGGLLPAFAAIPRARAAALARRIEALAGTARFVVPSHDPADPRFDAQRYWRGPAWLVVNYMIAGGLQAAGEAATADRVTTSSLDLIREGGFAEYYDPLTGQPLGGGRFTWTAAMVLELLRGQP